MTKGDLSINIVVLWDLGKSVGTNYVWRPLSPFNWGSGITLVENSVDNWLLEPGQSITYFATTTWVVWMAGARHYNFSRMGLIKNIEQVWNRVEFLTHGCSCKTGCMTRRCKCVKAVQQCGPGCSYSHHSVGQNSNNDLSSEGTVLL